MKKLNIRQFGIGTLIKYPSLISSDSKSVFFQIKFVRQVFTSGDGCAYVSIVNTGEGVRLINKNSNSVDQQVIIGMSISQNNRLKVFSIKDNNGMKTIWILKKMVLSMFGIMQMEFLSM